MYRLNQHTNRKPKNRLVMAACVVVLCVAVVLGYFAITNSLKEQGAESARQAILNSANQCMAIEGAYPTSLDHLKDEYGLSVNETDYDITYEVFAENVAPTVVVTPR